MTSHKTFMVTEDGMVFSWWGEVAGAVFSMCLFLVVLSGGCFQFWLAMGHGSGEALSDTCSQYVIYCMIVAV